MAETKSVAGTQTEKNLATSYLNESQSYARYTFYAQKAVKESYFPIGYAFNETAANELRHAKIFLNFLPGGKLVAEVPTDSVAIGSGLRRSRRQGRLPCHRLSLQSNRSDRTAPLGSFPDLS